MYHRLKALRKALGLNQQEFSRRLGLSQSTLAMMEVGKRNLNEKHIKLICSYFKVNECWLRTGEGEMFGASPHESEFLSIFEALRPETQQYLLDMARGLLATEKKLLDPPPGQGGAGPVL